MVSVVIVGIFAGATIGLIAQGSTAASVAAEKQAILNATKSKLQTLLNAGSLGTLTAGTTDSAVDLGMPFQVKMRTEVTAVLLEYRLYDVKVTASWDANTSKNHAGSIVLQSRIFNEP